MIAFSLSARAEAGGQGLERMHADQVRNGKTQTPHGAFADLIRPSSSPEGDDMFARAFDECGLLGASGQDRAGRDKTVKFASPPSIASGGEAASPASQAAPVDSAAEAALAASPPSAHARASPTTPQILSRKPTHNVDFARTAIEASALRSARAGDLSTTGSDAPENLGRPPSLSHAKQAAAHARASAVFVALVQTELGARLLARVRTLSIEDRQRLRAEIAHLLARHGLDATIDIQARDIPA